MPFYALERRWLMPHRSAALPRTHEWVLITVYRRIENEKDD
jgi:hypothetical protein